MCVRVCAGKVGGLRARGGATVAEGYGEIGCAHAINPSVDGLTDGLAGRV